MKTVKVGLGDRSYRILIEAGIIDHVGEHARSILGEKPRCAFIVSNPTVDALYGSRLAVSFKRAGFSIVRRLIGDGERYKNLITTQRLYSQLIQERLERSDIIVALGGGVVGDISGFVAGTYLRGIKYVQVPTTLLAHIDSSVGGKTGVNHKLGKNMIGVFHQPSLVVIDPVTLKTLPERQVRAGLYEAIKYGVIRDSSLFNRITGRMGMLKCVDIGELSHLITRSCRIKAKVVELDEREGGLRRILNFGHTVGHALESITHYRRFLHGEAVGYGMRAAARVAEEMGLLDPIKRETICRVIKELGRLPRADDIEVSEIISAMLYDKKVESGHIVMILPEEIGSVVIRDDISSRALRSALRTELRD